MKKLTLIVLAATMLGAASYKKATKATSVVAKTQAVSDTKESSGWD